MLEFLLDPITTDQFLLEYYEKKHLVIKRRDRDKYADILTYRQLDDLLFSATLNHPHVRVVNNAEDSFPDPKTYTIADSTRIDPLKFVRQYAEGNTLAMAGLQDKIFSLRRLTNQLGAFFQHNFQTNIYLTPRNSQGFAPHYDTHDVFVLQFAGRKNWRIYDNTRELPTRAMAFEKGKYEPGNLIDEFVLEEGDMLYIPRGVVHDAFCEGSSSGHVTLGLTGKTWANHLAEFILRQSVDHVALRRYPRFHQGFDPTAEEVMTIIAGLTQEFITNEKIKDDFYGKEKSISRGQLLRVVEGSQVFAKSIIRLNEPQQLRLRVQGNGINLKYYDTAVTLPQKCQGFLEQVIRSDSGVRISDIECELNMEGRVVLATELAKNGMLEVYK